MSPSSTHQKVWFASMFSQTEPPVICSFELFWATKLEVLEVHFVLVLLTDHFCLCFAACANPGKGSCCLLPSATPGAKLHSGGRLTSPCSAPLSLGIGWTASCSTKERARCFHPATAAEFLTTFRSIIQKQFFSSALNRHEGAFTDPVAHSPKMSWWKMARASVSPYEPTPTCLIAAMRAAISLSLRTIDTYFRTNSAIWMGHTLLGSTS